MLKLSFILSDLGHKQSVFYVANEMNKAVLEHKGITPILFYESLAPPVMRFLFPTMNISEVFCYDGIVVATTLSTANRLLNVPGPKRKLFYVWDLEWMGNVMNVELVSSLYNAPQIDLVARSEDHAKVLERVFNRKPVGVVNDYNLDDFLKIVG